MKLLLISLSTWFKLILLSSAIAISACGGGGDDDDGYDEVVISPSFEFQIGGPLGGSAGNSFIDIEREDGISLKVEPDMQGQLICDQNTEVCEVQFVHAGSSITIVDQTSPNEFVGNIAVTVEDSWLFNSLVSSDRPVAGRFHVEETNEPIIVVEFTNCEDSSDREVQVTYDPGSNQTVKCYQWDNFEDLFDSSSINVERYERQASFAWEAAEYIVLEQSLNVLEVFPSMVDDVFAANNPLSDDCEIYSGDWDNGPSVNPGNLEFYWGDDNTNSQIGPGDSLSQSFNECWLGDTSEGVLIEGVIDHVGYVEEIDYKGLLTRIGFNYVELGNGSDPIVFTETTNENNDVVTDLSISLIGKYVIDFN